MAQSCFRRHRRFHGDVYRRQHHNSLRSIRYILARCGSKTESEKKAHSAGNTDYDKSPLGSHIVTSSPPPPVGSHIIIHTYSIVLPLCDHRSWYAPRMVTDYGIVHVGSQIKVRSPYGNISQHAPCRVTNHDMPLLGLYIMNCVSVLCGLSGSSL